MSARAFVQRFLTAAAVATAALAVAAPVRAQVMGQPGGMAMPDPSQMSGVPLPSGDLPVGTVTVLVVRGSMTNPVSGQSVQLHAGGKVLDQKTDASGHATFSGLTPGTPVQAVTTVDGHPVESRTFPVPDSGGVRLALVATDAATAAREAENRTLAAGPAQPGMVVLSAGSQFVADLDDDRLTVYYLLQVANSARVPVEPKDPLVFELPPDASGAAVLDGSSPLAAVTGHQLTIRGPFPPGMTGVQAAYTLPYDGETVTITQRLPVALEQLSLVVQKATPAMHMSSAQVTSHGEMPADGKTYLVGSGPGIAAGNDLTFTITGLPHRATWPRWTALSLATIILVAGLWFAASRGGDASTADARRKTLQGRRDRLFADLVRLEEQQRGGQVDERRYAARRQELVSQLERVYSELDQDMAA